MTAEELAKLTPEEKRIRIAELCGYAPIPWRRGRSWTKDERYFFLGDRPDYEQLPDYLNDLNAMHEAEKILKDDEGYRYKNAIQSLAVKYHANGELCGASGFDYHATSVQRADAFLLTLSCRSVD